VALSGVTDPYQPIERRLELTRGSIGVLAAARNPVAIITKNDMVVRDAGLLSGMAEWDGAVVNVSITTLDAGLAGRLEPRASTPGRRLDAVRRLSDAGVPVGVLVAPVIPGLTDHELPAILDAAAEAGARFAGSIPLRLPHGVADLFEAWLETHEPGRREKVMRRILSMREGRRNDPEFGSRMHGSGAYADQIRAMFRITCRRLGLETSAPKLSISEFRRPDGKQRRLFT
jgi:DNA repair photolyase